MFLLIRGFERLVYKLFPDPDAPNRQTDLTDHRAILDIVLDS